MTEILAGTSGAIPRENGNAAARSRTAAHTSVRHFGRVHSIAHGEAPGASGAESSYAMRVLFVLPHLLTDGPSRQWSILIPGLIASGHAAAVVTLDAKGRFFDELQGHGVATCCAEMRRRTDLRRLGRAIRAVSPDVPHVVVSHGPGPQLHAQVLSWCWRAPHVTVEHRSPELALRRDQEAIVKMVAPHTRCVIAVTSKQVPRLVRRG